MKFTKFVGPHSNQKFYARDFRNGYRFRPDVNPVRQKFQGYVNFIFNRNVLQFLANNNLTFKTSISSLVRRATLPAIDYKVQTKNQFNKRRLVQTGLDYKPLEITVYDTINNDWLTVLMKYYAYNFMNPRNKNKFGDRDIELNKDMVNEMFGSSFKGKTFASNEQGLNLQNEANFFERIDIILYHGGKGVQYSVTNPMMLNFNASDIDYSSSEAMDFTMSFDYENFTTYDIANFDLTSVDLDRFEDLPDGFTFYGDDQIIKPLGAEVETDFEFLGNKASNSGSSTGTRPRTAQPADQYDITSPSDEDSNFFQDLLDGNVDLIDDDSIFNGIDDLINDSVNTIALKPTYDDYATSLKNKAIGAIGGGIVDAIRRGVSGDGGS